MALIKCSDLELGYESQTLVSGLSFEVNAGDYLCIVGENGSGKTTLMRTLLSLIKPLGGKIEFGDGLTSSAIGYLPQQTDVQRDFPASVREIVLSGCLGGGKTKLFYSKDDKKRAEDNMKRMEIEPLADRCYRELSGGQQQRVLLARALCAADKLILLDEPVAGLDPRRSDEMYSLIKSLNDRGMTVIMISHDLHSVRQYATRVLHIGHKLFFGSVEEYDSFAKGGGLDA